MTIHSFTVGDFRCTVLSDGAFTYARPAQILFPQAPQAQAASALHDYGIVLDEWAQYELPNLCLLVETGQQRVLIDTGSGPVSPKVGHLLPHLQALGITPAAIDVVILSHGHLDHSGGTVDAQGQPAFPKARYVLSTAEWNFWMDKPDLSPLKLNEQIKQKIIVSARANLQPLDKQLELVEDGTEIVPGIYALLAPGHTPGHMALWLRSQGEALIYLADMVLHPLHVQQTEWIPTVDLLPQESVVTRRRLLGQAARNKTLVHLYHFPFPGLGYIAPNSAGWQWQPL